MMRNGFTNRLPNVINYRANLTTSPVRTASSIANVTSKLLRASCGLVSVQGLPVATWSSRLRVSLASGPQNSPPDAARPGVPAWSRCGPRR